MLRARHSSARTFLSGRSAFLASGAPCAESIRDTG
jgi:hypothetical protein